MSLKTAMSHFIDAKYEEEKSEYVKELILEDDTNSVDMLRRFEMIFPRKTKNKLTLPQILKTTLVSSILAGTVFVLQSQYLENQRLTQQLAQQSTPIPELKQNISSLQEELNSLKSQVESNRAYDSKCAELEEKIQGIRTYFDNNYLDMIREIVSNSSAQNKERIEELQQKQRLQDFQLSRLESAIINPYAIIASECDTVVANLYSMTQSQVRIQRLDSTDVWYENFQEPWVECSQKWEIELQKIAYPNVEE